MADFLWNSSEDKRKIHWLAWEKICLGKDRGGLGMKDIQCFHQALLAKQAWRILTNPKCLLARLLKSRYFGYCEFLNAIEGSRPSYGWKSILGGAELLKKGLKKRIGNGKSIYVWTEKWIQDVEMKAPLLKNCITDICQTVDQLIDFRTRTWNKEVLEDLFYPEDVLLILKMKPLVSRRDFWIWEHTRSGDYSVKTGYSLAHQTKHAELIRWTEMKPSTLEIKQQIWKLQTSPKIKAFIWKSVSEALPVVELLEKRNIKVDSRCQVCGNEGESINHVLFSCSLSRQIWAVSSFPVPPGGFDELSLFSNIHYLLVASRNKAIPMEIRNTFPWLLWYIWKNRNGLFFEGKVFLATEVVQKSALEAEEWFATHMETRKVELNIPVRKKGEQRKWKRPPDPWLKCNVGYDWSKEQKTCGAAWILRDSRGVSVMHSRRSFPDMESKDEAKFQAHVWAFRSMVEHRLNGIIFGSIDTGLVKAMNKPEAWPSFAWQVEECGLFLKCIKDWRMEEETFHTNQGAWKIAHSVIKDRRSQSYVAVGPPLWLSDFLEQER